MKIFGARKAADSFSFELTQSRDKIIEKFEERINNYKLKLFATELSENYIHYANFKIENERIVIHQYRSPPIYIYVEDIPGGKSMLRVEQENPVSQTNTFLTICSAIIFVLLFFYIVGDVSIGTALLIALIPSLGFLLFLLSIFYLKEQIRKNYLKRFANKIARSIQVD